MDHTTAQAQFSEEAVIASLQPKTAYLARELKKNCMQSGFPILILRGLRSFAEQEMLYAQGRTRPGAIITRRSGGWSFHNFGLAFDISPMTADNEGCLAVYKKAGAIGKELGLEWGGDWREFIDMPHFQFTNGYTIEAFRSNSVDWGKFNSM